MQALRVQEGSKKEQVERVDIPRIGPQEVLIKVKSAGLAPGPFRMVRMGVLSHLPATLGHEAAGVVDAVGELVQGLSAGDRVRVHTSMSCRSCDYCLSDRDQMCDESGLMGFQGFGKGSMPLFERYRNGGLAEYIRAPYWLVDVLPDHVSFDVGCKVNEFATALCTLKKANLRPGSTVIITAATGAIGTALLKLAPLFGIHRLVLVGRSSERLQVVTKLTTIQTDIVATDQLSEDWSSTRELAQKICSVLPRGADAIIDLTPSGSVTSQSMASLRVNGTIVHLGGSSSILPIPMVVIMANCWTIVGTRNHSRLDAKTILKWLSERKLDVNELITHRWTFDQIEEAIARLEDRSLPIWMSVVNF
ncbi:hypothetical protein H2198_006455 [Neophaeococcomyces mojaviensis]|uniref:Uncharacterized protein n=1 Tax=Neophaeococcomyces mojaviensis TaxID=3383035 RepID=A0ACC3A3C9_9EURO|nr:hypothetical protein H2198_006455 [Knufia sp. JES_112]